MLDVSCSAADALGSENTLDLYERGDHLEAVLTTMLGAKRIATMIGRLFEARGGCRSVLCVSIRVCAALTR